jgi:cellulose synthase (UDP-forming)
VLRYVGLWQGWWPRLNDHTPPLLFWLVYNVLIMLISVFSADDQPHRRESDRFPLKTPCTISIDDQGDPPTVLPALTYAAYTQDVSEGGALLVLQDSDLVAGDLIQLQLPAENFSVRATVRRCLSHPSALAVQFTDMTTEQRRRIVELLYTAPKPWWQRKQPGLTDSVLAIFAALFGVSLAPIYAPNEEKI